MASLPELTRRAVISSTPDLGGCRPGGVKQSALKAQGLALSRLGPLSDYRAAKAQAAKSAMTAFLGAVLAFSISIEDWVHPQPLRVQRWHKKAISDEVRHRRAER
jgi:hypothetical protein